MIKHIPVVAQNESINDLKKKYSIGYNLKHKKDRQTKTLTGNKHKIYERV
jgi:hypothetical protein